MFYDHVMRYLFVIFNNIKNIPMLKMYATRFRIHNRAKKVKLQLTVVTYAQKHIRGVPNNHLEINMDRVIIIYRQYL